jgi:phage host-nuclease inhibitor protein Gam
MDRHKPQPSIFTEEQVTNLLRKAADIESAQEVARMEAEANIKSTVERYEKEKRSLEDEYRVITNQIHSYLQTNKVQFTKPKSKDLSFGGLVVGTIGFRTVGAKMKIAKDDTLHVIADLISTGMGKFVKQKPSIDNSGLKKHMLENPELYIPGVQIIPKHDGPFFTVNRNPEDPGK